MVGLSCRSPQAARLTASLPFLPIQWFERVLDVAGIAASAINVYVTKARPWGGCLL